MSKTRPIVVTATKRPGRWDVTVLPTDRRVKIKVVGSFDGVLDTAEAMRTTAIQALKSQR